MALDVLLSDRTRQNLADNKIQQAELVTDEERDAIVGAVACALSEINQLEPTDFNSPEGHMTASELDMPPQLAAFDAVYSGAKPIQVRQMLIDTYDIGATPAKDVVKDALYDAADLHALTFSNED